MKQLIFFLALATASQAGDLDQALKRVLSPENVIRNIAQDMRAKSRLQKRFGHSTDAQINEALADELSPEDLELENKNLKETVIQLQAEIIRLRRDVDRLHGFCLKVKEVLQSQPR